MNAREAAGKRPTDAPAIHDIVEQISAVDVLKHKPKDWVSSSLIPRGKRDVPYPLRVLVVVDALDAEFLASKRGISSELRSEEDPGTNVIELLHDVDLSSEHLHRLRVFGESLLTGKVSDSSERSPDTTRRFLNDFDRDQPPRALLHTLVDRGKRAFADLSEDLVGVSKASAIGSAELPGR